MGDVKNVEVVHYGCGGEAKTMTEKMPGTSGKHWQKKVYATDCFNVTEEIIQLKCDAQKQNNAGYG